MIVHLFPKFLEDEAEYAQAAEYWVQLWEQINPAQRSLYGWQQPWLMADWETDNVFKDGNPIFTAYTPLRQKAIRVIQHPPTSSELQFQYWCDTFGESPGYPDAIDELVIACALSEEASAKAFELLETWVRGGLRVEHPRYATGRPGSSS